MDTKYLIHKNVMNDKTTKFLDRFVKRVKANPPGVCPIAVQLAFYRAPDHRPAVSVYPAATDWSSWKT